MLDTVREIETPEGVFLRLRAAGPLPRAQAWTIDLLLRLLVLSLVATPLALFGVGGRGLLALVMFALTWGYPVACEVWFHGQTPGKSAMGLRVVRADGAPVTWIPSVIRNLLRVVDALPGVYGVGLAASLIDPYARRLGDVVAGTMVIHASAASSRSQLPVVAGQPLPQVLDAEEQAALVEFAERSAQLTVQRQEELADMLVPLTGREGTAAVQQLVAYANGLLGRT